MHHVRVGARLSLLLAVLLSVVALPATAKGGGGGRGQTMVYHPLGSSPIQVGVQQNMEAYLLTPDGPGPFPAILLLHTSKGLEPWDFEFAKQLVQEGYVVLVPAFMAAYGIQTNTRQRTFTTEASAIYADFVASLALLRGNKKVDGRKLGAIGFSNGGYFALWLAATGKVDAGISYYGALSGAGTDKSLNRFRESFSRTSAPVLILHGADDSQVPVTNAIQMDRILTEAQSPHEFRQYPDAEHRFEREPGSHNAEAASDAWRRTRAFLDRLLKG